MTSQVLIASCPLRSCEAAYHINRALLGRSGKRYGALPYATAWRGADVLRQYSCGPAMAFEVQAAEHNTRFAIIRGGVIERDDFTLLFQRVGMHLGFPVTRAAFAVHRDDEPFYGTVRNCLAERRAEFVWMYDAQAKVYVGSWPKRQKMKRPKPPRRPRRRKPDLIKDPLERLAVELMVEGHRELIGVR